jgi:site-specific recombinase XerD
MEGPLKPFAANMVEHLESQGYASETVIRKMRLVGKLSCFLQETGRAVGDLGTATLEEFADEVGLAPSDRVTPTTLVWLIELLAESGELAPAVVPTPPDDGDLLGRYRHYLAVERGLLPKTVTTYERVAQHFLIEHPEHDLGNLSPAAVARYVTRECRRLDSIRGAERLVTVLRSLLTFALLDGVIPSPLSAVVPSVARWGGASLPRGLAPDQLAAMLASCDRGGSKGKRDYAILVLLSRLGLRAAEAAALCLEDIDWRAGEIVVRGKGRSEEQLPLPFDVGAAIADYLRHGRPNRPEQREVFLRLVAPPRGLSPDGVSEVVRAASERAGVGSFGAHRLRHTAGTEMLRAGASLPEVAQVLRHRRIATTAIYAKVDHLALRELAMPWPGAAR